MVLVLFSVFTFSPACVQLCKFQNIQVVPACNSGVTFCRQLSELCGEGEGLQILSQCVKTEGNRQLHATVV